MILDIFYKEQKFNSAFTMNCFRNCIQQMLSYYGVENEMYYINCVPKLELIKDINHSHFGYALLDKHDFINVLPKFEHNICTHINKKKDPIQVWEINKEMLQKDIPIIVGVDGLYLNYQHINQHSVHAVILSGYNKKDVYIIDWYETWFFKGSVSIDSFLKARASNVAFTGNNQVSANNLWIEVGREGWNATVEELTVQTLQLMIDSFYNVIGKENKHYYGIYALQELVCIVCENEIIENRGINFYMDLYNKLFKYLTIKKLFLYYLKCVYESKPVLELEQLIIEETLVIEKWKIICLQVYKASFRKNNERMKLLIVNKMEEAIMLEANLYESLVSCKEVIERKM